MRDGEDRRGKAWKGFSINRSKLHQEGWRWEGASDIGYEGGNLHQSTNERVNLLQGDQENRSIAKILSAQVHSEMASELGRCAEFEPHGHCWDDDRTLLTAIPWSKVKCQKHTQGWTV